MWRSIRRLSFLSLAAAPLAACYGEEGEPAVDVEAEAQTIRTISQQWLEYQRARDAASIAGLFAEDGVGLYPDNDPWEGPSGVQAGQEEEFAEFPAVECDWSTVSVEVDPGGRMAWERGEFTCDPDGPGALGADSGSYLTVYKKIGGEWKVAADISTTHHPGTPAESEG
ncbi:MAG: YybH family protein [Gemmatimonadota bacterium]